jgi:hypothetical protein
MKLHIAIPAFGAMMSTHCVRSLLDLRAALWTRGIDHDVDFIVHESLIPRARNLLAAMSLEDPVCTHTLFIDADIKFRFEDVLAMLDADRDIVCGAYPAKAINMDELLFAVREEHPDPLRYATRMVVNILPPPPGQTSMDIKVVKGCVPIGEGATGFMMIKRQVFERMIAAYPETMYYSDQAADAKGTADHRGQQLWALFDCAVRGKRYVSEDYLFCQRWREIGGEVHLYLAAQLGHVGQHIYTGDVYKTFVPTAVAEAAE